jgi:hypothetical protein
MPDVELYGGSNISSINLSGLPSVNVDSTLFTYLFGPPFFTVGSNE